MADERQNVTEAMIERGIDAYRKNVKDGIRNYTDIVTDILEAALRQSPSAAPIAVKVSETYYGKGKDAEHFEKLSDKDFAWALTCAAQDINDSDENVSEWMPVTALLDGAADRITRLSAIETPAVPEVGGKPMTGFVATLTDKQKRLAREYVGPETHGEDAAS